MNRPINLPAPPVSARHAEYSMIFSADDDPGRVSPILLQISLDAIKAASEISLADICIRIPDPPYYPEIWPGEHYRLLAGLVKTLQPKSVVEIGTATGLSALALKKFLPRDGKVTTFDLVPWQKFPNVALTERDFEDGRLAQYTEDLSHFENVTLHRKLLERADLIFIDAAKDGQTEDRIIDFFRSIVFDKPPLVIFDDIRVWSMLAVWRKLRLPKLDLTSFGHWSGTGIAEWDWR